MLGNELTYIHYSNYIPGQIQYKSVEFKKVKLILEDTWYVQFFPNLAKEIDFLKMRPYIASDYKPYGSDVMNNGGLNNKDQSDMLLYFNILLSTEEEHISRQKYTWIDAFSFAGGFIDIILIGVGLFFSFWNYRLNETKILYYYE